MHPYYSHGQRSAAYDLPPVQSIVPLSHPPFQQQPPPPLPAATSAPAILSAPPSRPGSSMKLPHLLQPLSQHIPTAAPSSSSPYSRSYESASVSPTEGASVLPDAAQSNGSISGNTQFLYQLSDAGQQHQLPPQKRAYRQRRKDPSCDACRERKVKCDASESASCTECINRKVRCQFTKETNRRMSSIKQVQDLEKQLLSTKQQLQQLRSGMNKSDSLMDTDFDNTSNSIPVRLPDDGTPKPTRRTRGGNAHNLSDVRSNLCNYGRGVMKVPAPYRQQDSSPLMAHESPNLPAKNYADLLLTQYISCIHPFMPLIHWPSFVVQYDRVYQSGSLAGVPRDWAACLFAAFACASLHTREPNKVDNGKGYLRVCDNLLDIFTDDVSMDKVRAALLASLFLHEVGSKSASWVWMGSAVRLGQEIGLHLESGPWSAAEMETRRPIWWGLYCWDRILSLEIGKPAMINDQDQDVDLPYPVDDQYMVNGNGGGLDGQQSSVLLAMIHVVRSLGQLFKALQSPIICPTTLETFERQFTACLTTLPTQYHPKCDQYLDPRTLLPIICLQNARFTLHRHNLSPACSHDARRSAMDYCLSTALDTARLLSRCMQDPPGSGPGYAATGITDWRSLLAMSAFTMVCTHIYRCVLLLLFRQEYAAALVCIQACATINDSRETNVASGRYIAFFLRCLLDRLRRNDIGNLERDEEIIAYMSGDIQGTIDGNWVWQDSGETGLHMGDVSPNISAKPTSLQWSSTAEPEMEWEGWDWIERTVQYLVAEKQQPRSSYMGYDRTDDMKQYPSKSDSSLLTPETAGSADTSPRRSSSAQSRMTIANII